MKNKYSILKYLFIISLFSFIFFLSCSDSSNNSGEKSNTGSFEEIYADSMIFLSNRFSSDESVYHICIIDENGNGLRLLSDKWDVQRVSWSLRKGKIYFASNLPGQIGASTIYESDLQGNNERELYYSNFPICDLRVSPDGSTLAILIVNEIRTKLLTMDVSTGELIEFGGWSNELKNISWSPDGDKLGCMLKIGGDVHLKTLSLNSSFFSEVRLFIDMVSDYNFIDWCKATNKIALNLNHYGFSISYIYDYIAKSDTNFTAGNYFMEGLSWSPHGDKISFAAHYNHLSVSSIYVLKKNGTGAQKLTDDLFDDKYPCWQ